MWHNGQSDIDISSCSWLHTGSKGSFKKKGNWTHQEQREPEVRAVSSMGTLHRGSRSKAESFSQYRSTLVDEAKSCKVWG